MKDWKKNPFRIVWLFVGFLCMGIGAVGVVLPVLPTTPFLLLASFCLAKGSDRFHRWFTETTLYQKHLESFVKDRSMTLKYRSRKLFDREAMLLWREPVVCVDDTEVASSRYLELWLLEDMSVAVVSCVQIVYGDGNDYITEYREYKGEEIPFSELVPDLLDFVDRLESLCPDEYHPDEVVIYET